MWSKNVSFESGVLHLSGIPAAKLAQEFGTPAFFLDEDAYRSRALAWQNGLQSEFGAHAGTIYYAAKSFICTAVAQWIADIGIGIDVCTGGELAVALAGGIDPKKSLFEVVSDGLDFMKVGQVEMPSRAYVAAFGFKGPDQQKPAGVLSGGELNRLNLALTLKHGGNLLLLDEPTNDLDVETLGSLENALLEFPGCAVVISHDRWFLDRVATHILAYEGESKWFWFEGNFESYEENKIARLGADAARPHRVTYRKLTR